MGNMCKKFGVTFLAFLLLVLMAAFLFLDNLGAGYTVTAASLTELPAAAIAEKKRIGDVAKTCLFLRDSTQENNEIFTGHLEDVLGQLRVGYRLVDVSKEAIPPYSDYRTVVIGFQDLEVLGGNHREEYPDYLGQCASLDKNLGRLVNKLKEMGIYEDTVIIYLADHGSHFMTRNQDAHLNGYDDYKRSMHDACLRVPLVVTGGEFTGGGVVTDLISTAGLPRTILGIAGVDVGDKMIGEDFADVLHKPDPDRPNEVFAQISESRVGRAIRTADYAYSVYAPGINGGAQPAADLYADDFFYDLKKDPYELNNLIDDPAYTQVKQELRKKLLKWIHLAENAEPEIVDG